MNNRSSSAKNQSGNNLGKPQSSSKTEPLSKKRQFYRYSDFDKKNILASEEDDDDDEKKRKGQKEWDEEYRELDEDDLGTDFGKP